MTPGALLSYLGGALGQAGLGTVLIAGLLRLLRGQVRTGQLALALATLFVVFLGLSPYPDPASLDCTSGGVQPILKPFGFLDGYIRFWQAGLPLSAWLTSLSIVSPIMNVVFFALVGLPLAGQIRSWLGALAYAVALTAFIETAQLTALFGLYPCPYRHFEIDDLILNITGVMLGFALARGWAARAV